MSYQWTCKGCGRVVSADNHTVWPWYSRRPKVIRQYQCGYCNKVFRERADD